MRETASSFLCEEVRRHLVAYGRGKLSLPSTQQVYAHLSRCSSCQTAHGQSLQAGASGVGSRTLRAGALATLGTALVFLYGMYLPSLQTSASSSAPVHVAYSAHAPISGFVGKPGGGYYLRLHAADPTAAEGTITRILAECPVLKAKGPYAGRYCIRATPKQLTVLMNRLTELGESETIQVDTRPWWFEDFSEDPNACSVMLDLLPPRQR